MIKINSKQEISKIIMTRVNGNISTSLTITWMWSSKSLQKRSLVVRRRSLRNLSPSSNKLKNNLIKVLKIFMRRAKVS